MRCLLLARDALCRTGYQAVRDAAVPHGWAASHVVPTERQAATVPRPQTSCRLLTTQSRCARCGATEARQVHLRAAFPAKRFVGTHLRWESDAGETASRGANVRRRGRSCSSASAKEPVMPVSLAPLPAVLRRHFERTSCGRVRAHHLARPSHSAHIWAVPPRLDRILFAPIWERILFFPPEHRVLCLPLEHRILFFPLERRILQADDDGDDANVHDVREDAPQHP